jgi:anti-sigma B factor antagonist
VTPVPASHRRRIARRSSSTSPPHTPCAPMPNACRSESSRQSGRTGQRTQTAMACAAWSRALATSRVTGNQSSGSTREPAVSGDVDVCTEAPLQQALLRIIRERGARLMVDVSGVSFMDCAGLRALLATRRRAELLGGFMRLIATSAAVRRIIELTGAHEALATERSTTDRSVQFF